MRWAASVPEEASSSPPPLPEARSECLRQGEGRSSSPGRRRPVPAAASVVAASGLLARRARRQPARWRRRPRRRPSPWSVGAWRESRASVSQPLVPDLGPTDRRTRSRRASVIASHICLCHASVRPPYRHGRAKSTAQLRMSHGGLRPQRRCDRGRQSAVRNTPWRTSRSSAQAQRHHGYSTRRRRGWRGPPLRKAACLLLFSVEWPQPPGHMPSSFAFAAWNSSSDRTPCCFSVASCWS